MAGVEIRWTNSLSFLQGFRLKEKCVGAIGIFHCFALVMAAEKEMLKVIHSQNPVPVILC